MGVPSNKSTDVWDYDNRLTEVTDDTGTLLTSTSTNTGYYMFGKNGVTHPTWQSFMEYSAPFVAEVDIVSFNSDKSGFALSDGTITYIRFWNFNNLNETTNHFKIVVDTNNISIYVNMETTPDYTLTISKGTSYFAIMTYDGIGNSVKYKNLQIYRNQ